VVQAYFKCYSRAIVCLISVSEPDMAGLMLQRCYCSLARCVLPATSLFLILCNRNTAAGLAAWCIYLQCAVTFSGSLRSSVP